MTLVEAHDVAEQLESEIRAAVPAVDASRPTSSR